MTKKILFVAAILAGTTFATVISNPQEATYATCQAATQNPNSDGFIYKGTITLTRVVSGQQEVFYLFNKGGVDYVAKSKWGPYYRLSRRMTIGHIDYKL